MVVGPLTLMASACEPATGGGVVTGAGVGVAMFVPTPGTPMVGGGGTLAALEIELVWAPAGT